MGRLITQADVESRISPKKLRNLTDDGNFGRPDADAVGRAITDSENRVFNGVLAAYVISAPEAMTPTTAPEAMRTLALDYVVAFLAQRHPEVMRLDWKDLMTQADKDLTAIRKGEIVIGLQKIETPVTRPAGDVYSGLIDTPDAVEEIFNRTGLF